jgi:FMN phosphatase YigB (HAD superfamily)
VQRDWQFTKLDDRIMIKHLLFDWGDTVMVDFKEFTGAMYLWPVVKKVDGIERFLQKHHKKFCISLVTNAADSEEWMIKKALERVELENYFNNIFCFRSIGFKKPAPEFYKKILEKLQAGPNQVLMIGDSFDNDVVAASNIGMNAIWLNLKNSENKNCDKYITAHSFNEADEYVINFNQND